MFSPGLGRQYALRQRHLAGHVSHAPHEAASPSELDLFGDCKGIIDFDSKVTDGTFDLRMSEKQLTVGLFAVWRSHHGPGHRSRRFRRRPPQPLGATYEHATSRPRRCSSMRATGTVGRRFCEPTRSRSSARSEPAQIAAFRSLPRGGLRPARAACAQLRRRNGRRRRRRRT